MKLMSSTEECTNVANAGKRCWAADVVTTVLGVGQICEVLEMGEDITFPERKNEVIYG